MRMTTLYAALSGAFLLGTAALSPAADTDKSTATTTATTTTTQAPAGSDIAHPIKNLKTAFSYDYRADKDRIKADYKTDRSNCHSMTGNAHEICESEAKGKQNIALAELEAKRKGTPYAQYEVDVTRAKATYDTAKHKCEDMALNDRAACKKQAKADEKKAIAEAKANRKNLAANTSTAAPSSTESTSTKKY